MCIWDSFSLSPLSKGSLQDEDWQPHVEIPSENGIHENLNLLQKWLENSPTSLTLLASVNLPQTFPHTVPAVPLVFPSQFSLFPPPIPKMKQVIAQVSAYRPDLSKNYYFSPVSPPKAEEFQRREILSWTRSRSIGSRNIRCQTPSSLWEAGKIGQKQKQKMELCR